MTELIVETPSDFSFLETMQAHGWRRLAPFVWDDAARTLTRVQQMDDGSVVFLTLRGAGDGGLEVVCEPPADPIVLAGLARRMLQLDVSLDEFHGFCRAHPALHGIPQARQGRMLVSPTLWEDYVKVVLTTNTTWAQTRSMTARVVGLFGVPLAADSSLRAFPSALQIASVPFAEFSEAARLGYRAASVHAVACEIATGRLDLEGWRDPSLPGDVLWKRLLSLAGVGPYAASCLMLYAGRGERVNCDSVARALVSGELGRAATDKDVHAFFAPYGRWQGLVYNFYPWTPSSVR